MKHCIIRFVIVLTISVSLVLLAGGCKHTASGAGKDIENMGEKIQEKTQ